VQDLELIGRTPVRINAGFFALRTEIFDVMNPGEELVLEPFSRLIEQRKLLSVPYNGFWQNMDTFKDKVVLDGMVAAGKPPWQLWN
jgi:glucose-1-phosphate cytidylyltransferase